MDITIGNIIDIVREASAWMPREGHFSVKEKGGIENIVTSADLEVQQFLTGRLADLLPGSGFLCEEEGLSDLHHEYLWIIDPIDGTANFARGNENCCISVALVKDGAPLMGVVYSPWRDELYSAEAGRGACCYMESNDFRRAGSAAVELCQLAAGKAELYFEMRLMPWDYAAAALILQEAGGTICDFDGNFPSLQEPSLVVAANLAASRDRILGTVHRHLAAIPY